MLAELLARLVVAIRIERVDGSLEVLFARAALLELTAAALLLASALLFSSLSVKFVSLVFVALVSVFAAGVFVASTLSTELRTVAICSSSELLSCEKNGVCSPVSSLEVKLPGKCHAHNAATNTVNTPAILNAILSRTCRGWRRILRISRSMGTFTI